MSSTQTIPTHHRQWLDIIMSAAKNGDLALMRGTVSHTNEPATILCAVSPDGDGVVFTPLAHLPDDNPYEYFNPIE